METEIDYSVLIARFLAGEASPEEAIMVEDWKLVSPENQKYYSDCELIFNQKKPSKKVQTWSAFEKRLQRQKKVKIVTFFTHWRNIAAVFIGLLVLSSILIFTLKSSEVLFFKSTDFAQNFKLHDGTSVQLAKKSEIELESGFGKNKRYIKLKGSAYFTVKHDENKPFRIQMDDLFIEDLGTKFDIQTGEDTIFIRVDEGSVKIFNAKGMNLVLNPTDKAYYVISNGTFKVTVESDYFEKAAPVKLIFENQRLETVIHTLNTAFGASIELENEALGQCRITCSFTDENLDVILDVITETLNLKREENENIIRLKGKGC